ncbi:hypothetical protein TVAG_178300 [Trichomonas vaginalis G3]|uniref:Uncharacterized protein n=1 Tax=Trichomonas vaginalis (strain ATCC PRA-98 / G3) TaxID=412133 RepID=A2DII2_TRIV3|nr:protein of unknown function (DUF3447) [Trichomonas vaginalis G3]EAY19786.1 hypothetical protein TVAG_178300 [Trichomonas vaginalis G3]KAI5523990.1 protein of unknown function (DUF3447) [Trichomonas vaginalis G3]|eukprot:XP_001580772.1 hypothetical protein [Trichomonas vaginalis G3]
MSEQDFHPHKFSEMRDICKSNIDSYNALYQLKTEKEEELKTIYKMIKTELIDSKIINLQNIIIRKIHLIHRYRWI